MKFTSQFLGVIVAALYGILVRVLMANDSFPEFWNIYSISFIIVTPIVIGIIPVFFPYNEIYKSKINSAFIPAYSVLLFSIIALTSKIEDLLCIFILGVPFMTLAGVTGLIGRLAVQYFRKNKKLYSLVALPLFLNPVENHFPDNIRSYEVENKIVIHQSDAVIWNYIVEVPEIKDEEFEKGFFNYIGIPRPVKSVIETRGNNVYRIGYFTDDFQLVESISAIEENKFVSFNIHIDKSKLRDQPTDRHLLKSKNFRFDNISYTIRPLDSTSAELILQCNYTLESKLNFYANFWANLIIDDFEKRLLTALKHKIEAEK